MTRTRFERMRCRTTPRRFERMRSPKTEARAPRRRSPGGAPPGGAMGAVVAVLALVGATACDLGDAGFDPGPPPEMLLCSEVGQGQTLEATGSLEGSELSVRIRHTGDIPASVISAVISDVENATFVEIRTEAPDLVVVLDVGSPASPTGRFTLEGNLQGSVQTCPVQRTFVFTISGGNVQVT